MALSNSNLQKGYETLDVMAQKAIAENEIVGLAIAVVVKDAVTYAKGFGVREIGKPGAVDADTAFQLASVSKPLGATVLAALVGEGKIRWDTKLTELDPTFEMYDAWVTREITIRDMYAHRSGLPEHAGDLLEDIGYDRAEVLHRLRFQRPVTSFRSAYAYTNFGMTEAAVAAASAYGLTWEDASELKLYKPLGMSATSSRYADFMARENKALNHVKENGTWVHKYQRQPDAQSPAGGASSSVNDLARWARLIMGNGVLEGKQIVDKDALTETHRPQMLISMSPINGLPGFYGLGWNVSYDQFGRLRLNHSGGFAMGEATYVALVPGEGVGVVVLTNAYPTGLTEGIGAMFLEHALNGTPTQDWMAIYRKAYENPALLGLEELSDYSHPRGGVLAPVGTEDYVGTYRNDFYGEIQVAEEDGELLLVQGPEGMRFALTHYEGDIFTYMTAGENASGTSGVYFSMGADGKATGVRIENLDVAGEGKFVRVHSIQA